MQADTDLTRRKFRNRKKFDIIITRESSNKVIIKLLELKNRYCNQLIDLLGISVDT